MEIFRELTKKIFTKEDLILLIEKINLVQGLIFKNINVPLSERAKKDIEKNYKDSKFSPFDFVHIIEELEKKEIVSKNPEKNRIFFENFKKYLQSIPQIKITIAFQPKKESINKISLWLEKEIKQKVILDLEVNPEIVGGAIIEYQGRQINLSLVREIDELFSQKNYELF